jgi:putative Mg2+ transporter-C (MgtC) family protein
MFDVSAFWPHLAAIGLAYALALPIGWERETRGRTAGVRTFPLLAVATCGYVLIAKEAFNGSPDAIARMMQGVIAGIGFLGGGAIWRHGNRPTGVTTAVSLWNTGAVGIAVALGKIEIAITLAVINLATLRLLAPLKRDITRTKE